MRVHYLQHVPFEGLGSIAPWLEEHGYEMTKTEFFGSAALPAIKDIDLLIVMGGPMSVNDEQQLPWLVPEKRFVYDAIAAGVPVLGICLGAQLIASALGARVYRNSEKEIGWFPVHGIPSSENAAFRFPPSLLAFHWHGETFDLPQGARLIAKSDGCLHQAFQIGVSVIGLQFHLETTPESAQAIVSHCRDELIPSTYVQSESDLLAVKAAVYDQVNMEMERVLAFLAKRGVEGP
jgi:GMP synthase-like glutamine amidotransferase